MSIFFFFFPGTGWIFLGNNDWWEYNLRLWECDIPTWAFTCKHVIFNSFVSIIRLNTWKLFRLYVISTLLKQHISLSYHTIHYKPNEWRQNKPNDDNGMFISSCLKFVGCFACFSLIWWTRTCWTSCQPGSTQTCTRPCPPTSWKERRWRPNI